MSSGFKRCLDGLDRIMNCLKKGLGKVPLPPSPWSQSSHTYINSHTSNNRSDFLFPQDQCLKIPPKMSHIEYFKQSSILDVCTANLSNIWIFAPRIIYVKEISKILSECLNSYFLPVEKYLVRLFWNIFKHSKKVGSDPNVPDAINYA